MLYVMYRFLTSTSSGSIPFCRQRVFSTSTYKSYRYPLPDTIATPQTLLKELRSFAYSKLPPSTKNKGLSSTNNNNLSSSSAAASLLTRATVNTIADDFPLDLANDVVDVTIGAKPLVGFDTASISKDDVSFPFPFQCTSCGSCCRTHASTVLLDSYDIYKMTIAIGKQRKHMDSVLFSRSHPHTQPSTSSTSLLDYYSPGFRINLGQLSYHGISPSVQQKYFRSFSGERNNISVKEDESPLVAYISPFNPDHKIPLRYNDGIIPIVFLNTRSYPLLSPTPDSKKGGIGKNPSKMRKVASGPKQSTTNNIADERCAFSVPKTSSDTANVSSNFPSLSCSLGPSGMPYACSLYPLGDFWTNKQYKYYSIDNKCEGFDKQSFNSSSSLSSPQTGPGHRFTDYIQRNGLLQHSEAAEWFRVLVTSYACSGIEEELGKVLEQVQNIPKKTKVPLSLAKQLPSWLYMYNDTSPNSSSISYVTLVDAPTAIAGIRKELITIWYKPLPMDNMVNNSVSFPEWSIVQNTIENQTFSVYFRLQSSIRNLYLWLKNN